MFLMSEPLIVKALKERVLKWERARGGVVIIKPASKNFTSLEISHIPIGFFGFERKTQITCTIDAVSESEMNEQWSKVYRHLKRLECELAWKGIPRRPIFINSKSLEPLALSLPGFQINPELTKILNLNKDIISLIKTIRPDDVRIQLLSTPQKIIGENRTSNLSEETQPLDVILKFYQSPEKITWLVTITKMLEQGLSYQKIIDALYSFFEMISIILKTVTKKYYDILTSEEKRV